MNRIDDLFSDLRSRDSKALMPFITAGDGGLEATKAVLPAIEAGGASVCEIGIPYSDPIADGPVIQASMTRALDGGVCVDQIFETVSSLRGQLSMGLVAMVSYSLVYRIGLNRFVNEARLAGFDGFIFPDLPVDEADEACGVVKEAGMILSMLIAPTTPIQRARTVARASSGFVYIVSRQGITGESAALPAELPARLNALRQVTDAPMAVGFGISTQEHVRQVVEVADAAIVGSAMVRHLHTYAQESGATHEGLAAAAREMTSELAVGLA